MHRTFGLTDQLGVIVLFTDPAPSACLASLMSFTVDCASFATCRDRQSCLHSLAYEMLPLPFHCQEANYFHL